MQSLVWEKNCQTCEKCVFATFERSYLFNELTILYSVDSYRRVQSRSTRCSNSVLKNIIFRFFFNIKSICDDKQEAHT